jgi:hypothetical protein
MTAAFVVGSCCFCQDLPLSFLFSLSRGEGPKVQDVDCVENEV